MFVFNMWPVGESSEGTRIGAGGVEGAHVIEEYVLQSMLSFASVSTQTYSRKCQPHFSLLRERSFSNSIRSTPLLRVKMSGHRVKSTTSLYAPLQTQDSVLLNVPPEIRNSIYHALCESAQAITVCYRGKRGLRPADHPLTRTCRQLREEFVDVWATCAAHHAGVVICCMNNLENVGKSKERLATLAPLDNSVQRTCVLKLHIDNHFERSVRRQRDKLSKEAKQIETAVEITFDRKTLDADGIATFMAFDGAVPPKVFGAFLRAVARCRWEQAEQKQAGAQVRVAGFLVAVERDNDSF